MNTIKKYLGIVWIALAIAVAYYAIGIFGGRLTSGKQDRYRFNHFWMVCLNGRIRRLKH